MNASRNRRTYVVLALLILLSMVAVACAPAPAAAPAAEPAAPAAEPAVEEAAPVAAEPAASEPQKGGDLILGFRRDHATLDPPILNSDYLFRLMNNTLLDPLVWQPEGGVFYPGLAESWEVNEDATEYIFHLREDVIFHDGTPFNAEAVKFTFDRIADPTTRALLTFLIGPYEGSEVIDDYTVKVNFSAPFPLFLHHLSTTGARPVSPTAVAQYGEDFGQNMVGTGPFKLAKWSKEEIILERFDEYTWSPEFLDHEGPAYLDRIIHRWIPEPATRVIALENGEVDYIDYVPAQEVKRLQDENYQVMIIDVPGLPQLVQMNVTHPPMDDKLVRQAVQYAIDQQVIVDVVFFGLLKPGYNILAAATPGYSEQAAAMYRYDPEKAKELLEQAGWVEGPDGIRVKDGERLSLDYVTTDTPDIMQTAEIIQGMLQQVGIELKIEGMDNAASLARYQVGDYHMGRLGEMNADPSVMSFPIHSRNITGGTQGNRSKYANPEVDATLDSAEREIDPVKRMQMYDELQEFIMDEAMIIGTFDQALIFANSPTVHNLDYDYMGRHFFINTWLEE